MTEVFYFDLERDGLHRYLGGGIPKGNITFISGPYGAAKSALVQRLAYGFLVHGYTVTYVSTELNTKGFIQQMESLDYPITRYLTEKKLLFVPVFPLIGEDQMTRERNIEMEQQDSMFFQVPLDDRKREAALDDDPSREKLDYLKLLFSEPKMFDSDIVIIDAFSTLKGSQATYESSIERFRRFASRNKTVILTGDPTSMDTRALHLYNTITDLLIELKLEMLEGRLERLMVVRRFLSAQGRVGDVTGFRVEPGIGLILDITTVA